MNAPFAFPRRYRPQEFSPKSGETKHWIMTDPD
jgi:hypothetical protein